MKKKIVSVLLVGMLAGGLLTACGSSSSDSGDTSDGAAVTENETGGSAAEETASGDTGSGPEWSGYDELISQIRLESDLEARVGLLHEAEDMLMDTWAAIPLYYYVNQAVQSDDLTGTVTQPNGMRYFQYASFTDGRTTMGACLASEPDYLDPHLNSSVDGGILAVNSFEGLITVGADGEYAPGQAESWTSTENEDGTVTWTFTMRDGLKWSNGEPLDASDFEYSWKRAAAPETAADYSYLYDVIARDENDELMVSASEDGKTFTVTVTSICPYFEELCAFPAFFPVYEETVEANDENDTVPGGWALEASDNYVCNGAYTLSAWEHDSSMTYVKNENYRDAANVSIETINYMLTGDDATAFAAYKNGDLDLSLLIPTSEVANLNGSSDYHVDPYFGTYYVAFNVKSDMYENLGLTTEEEKTTFRKAIGLLIDRDYICEEIGQAGQVPANTIVPDASSDGNGGKLRENTDAYTYPYADELGYYSLDYEANKAEAIELLKSLGFEFNGDTITDTVSFSFLINEGTGNVSIAEAIQADLAQVGIDMKIETEEWNVFLQDRKDGNFDFAREGWIMDYNDPINILEIFTSDSGNNDAQLGK